MSEDPANGFLAWADRTGAVDLWDQWEREVQTTGRPDRLAAELSDEELVNLLSACPGLEDIRTAIALKQEALNRLHRAHRAERGNTYDTLAKPT